jgi:hypothetical protein
MEVIQGGKSLSPNPVSNSTPVPAKLGDAVAAFTFSRLPRVERIAAILWELAQKYRVEDFLAVRKIAADLEPYAVKDFAVRYGHLNDGKA